MNNYKNIKVREVDCGCGYVMDGDLSTLASDNVLTNLDYQFKELKQQLKETQEENEKLKEQLKEANEVIGFYGNKESWQDCRVKNDFITGIDMMVDREYFYIGGKQAREYLTKYKVQ